MDKSRLWAWLKNIEPCESTLTWCHVTSSWAFRDMVRDNVCRLSRCKVFKEPLLYFCYGRPAFRVDDEPLSKGGASPVVLLFDDSLVGEGGRRMFPFDSGAFQKHLYDHWFIKDAGLTDYELAVEPETPRRHISAFYGRSNVNYVRTQASAPERNHAGEFEVISLVRMLCECGREHADDRRTAVELQLARELPLEGGKLKAVVYPDEIEDAPWFQEFLKKFPRNKIEYRHYFARKDQLASEHQGLLEDRVLDIHQCLGAL